MYTVPESGRKLKYDAIRYSPEIRSAYIERFEDGPEVLTLYGKALYLDRSLLDKSRKKYVPMRLSSVCFLILRTAPRFVEVPEPLWTRKMLQTFLLLLCAHVAGGVRFRRTITSTYCIENEDPGRIARLPDSVPRNIRVAALRLPLAVFALLIRRWVFGTSASRDTYVAVLGPVWPVVDQKSALVWPLPSICGCPSLSEKSSVRVLFLGAVTARKGVKELMRAWDEVNGRGASLHLSILGDGDLANEVAMWAKRVENVEFRRSPSREDIHAELRAARVVVLLSKSEKYWREQIGLPLLEGLAHGCRIVTTSQTGIADWLTDHGHFVVDNASNPALVADAIQTAAAAGVWSTDELPDVNGRAAAAAVMHV